MTRRRPKKVIWQKLEFWVLLILSIGSIWIFIVGIQFLPFHVHCNLINKGTLVIYPDLKMRCTMPEKSNISLGVIDVPIIE